MPSPPPQVLDSFSGAFFGAHGDKEQRQLIKQLLAAVAGDEVGRGEEGEGGSSGRACGWVGGAEGRKHVDRVWGEGCKYQPKLNQTKLAEHRRRR